METKTSIRDMMKEMYTFSQLVVGVKTKFELDGNDDDYCN